MPELHTIRLIGPKVYEDGNSDILLHGGYLHSNSDTVSDNSPSNASQQPNSEVVQAVPNSQNALLSQGQNHRSCPEGPVPSLRLPRPHAEPAVSTNSGDKAEDDEDGKTKSEPIGNHPDTFANQFLGRNGSILPLSSASTSNSTTPFPVSSSTVSRGHRFRGGSHRPELTEVLRSYERVGDFGDLTALPVSQADLGNYLVGWSRYCKSLRIVQFDYWRWWERKFVNDRWILQASEKGKDSE